MTSDPTGTSADGAAVVSDGARRWAETMDGFGASNGARFAHATSGPPLGATSVLGREAREEIEDHLLAPGATRARGAGSRRRAEEPDELRTCFERDRDRILHSTAFRRLAGKTQVFVFPSDHQRTRLTHALEVAQVARAIATALRLNVALAEAIALGHDCGHGPGGHASEDAFSVFLEEGFDHAVFGADVTLVPLNLTSEVLDGVRNHSWSRPVPATPEGEVVSWADRIAYVCHDFEDAVHAGIVSPAELPALVRAGAGERRGAQIGAFVTGLVSGSSEAGHIAMPGALADGLAAFRRFNYERIYLRAESVAQSDAVIAVLRALVEHLTRHPEQLPAPERTADGPKSRDPLREAVTYVAGMTDRYAFDLAVEAIAWPPEQLPIGVDVTRLRRSGERSA